MQRSTQAAVDPQTKPRDLGCESTCRQLSSTTTIAIYYYYSARKLMEVVSGNNWSYKTCKERSSQNVTVDKPTPSFFTGRMFFSRPTNSVRALKGKAPHCSVLFISSRQTSSTCVVSSHALPMLTDCLICDVVSKQLRNLTSVWHAIPSLCLWTRSVHCLLFLDSGMSDWLQRFRIIVLTALKIAGKWSVNIQRL